MKTTIELPDDLFREAKTLAVRRKTTLKALIEGALRREISPAAFEENPDPAKYEIGPFGILSLKKTGRTLAPRQMRKLIEQDQEDEDAPVITRATRKP